MNDISFALLPLCSPVLISDLKMISLIFPNSTSQAIWVLPPFDMFGSCAGVVFAGNTAPFLSVYLPTTWINAGL